MLGKRKSFIIVIAIISAVLALNVVYRYSRTEKILNINLDIFPEKFDEWQKTKEIVMSNEVLSVLDPDNYLFREYENKNGGKVLLCIIYHTNDRYGAHTPQVCYTSQGWDIQVLNGKDTREVDLQNEITGANQFFIKKSGETQNVLYWFFSSENKQMASRFLQMLYNLKVKLLNGNSRSGFVRISESIHSYDSYNDTLPSIPFASKVSKILEDVVLNNSSTKL